jgi:nucleoside-triphosphatase
MDMTIPLLWALTGPRGAGKTTFCRTLAERARAAGWDVAGLLSPGVFEDGVKTGILAQALRTGETHPLARVHPPPGGASEVEGRSPQLAFGNWLFDAAAFTWGNQVLEASLPCDLLIVDELGPLELVRGEGWTSALAVLRQPRYRVGLVVVRPELVEIARQSLPIARVMAFGPGAPGTGTESEKRFKSLFGNTPGD